uniref:Hyp5 n=1 Tax=Moniliophthora roreri (strain MCA 2997) TaxID=1381753 RepID=F2WVJ1_MONRO|nr:hyp5 [Moniliophthora roreri]ADO51588.1 hyp5 [Moniliophthora roreri]
MLFIFSFSFIFSFRIRCFPSSAADSFLCGARRNSTHISINYQFDSGWLCASLKEGEKNTSPRCALLNQNIIYYLPTQHS